MLDDSQLIQSEKTTDSADCHLLLGWSLIAFAIGYLLLPAVGMLIFRRGTPGQAAVAVGGTLLSLLILMTWGRIRSGSWRALFMQLDLKRQSLTGILLLLPMALVIALVGGALTLGWTWAAERCGIEFGLPPTIEIMRNGSLWQVIGLSFSALAAAPLFEEILFRKALNGFLKNWCGVIPAALITAVVFAAMHFSWQQLPGLMFFSIVWQWCYYRSRSLLTAVILHFFNNLFSVVMLWAVRCWGSGMDI